MIYNFLFYFLLFILYAMAGWLIEITYVYYTNHKLVNRGFLLGPYCPIYGYASIMMIFYLNNYKDNIITVFILATVVCSFVEYLVSYIMEKLFNARWWDYSDRKFNINGRVCLVNAFLFGLLSLLIIYIINPFITNYLANIKHNRIMIISFIILIIFVSDLIISIIATSKLKNNIKKINVDVTEEFNKLIKEKIESKFINRRIFNAFPRYKFNIVNMYSKSKKEIFKNKLNNFKTTIFNKK